jgi:hypothetical protein
MVDQARRRGLECGIGDVLEGLGFPDASFDLVSEAYVAHGLAPEDRPTSRRSRSCRSAPRRPGTSAGPEVQLSEQRTRSSRPFESHETSVGGSHSVHSSGVHQTKPSTRRFGGFQAAIRKDFLGSGWQRCKVHFMRNILARVGHRDKAIFAAKLKQVWLQAGKDEARRCAREFAAEYRKRFPEAVTVLEDGLEDSLSFYDFPMLDARKISSTNGLERLNREIRQRSVVVGVFPSEESYVRLVVTYLMEYAEG